MIENLQTYYEYLEKDTDLSDDNNLSQELEKLRDNTGDVELKKILNCEIYLNDFEQKRRKYNSISKGFECLSFKLFEDIEHLKSRAKEITNDKYKAKYNHFLYIKNIKNRDNATNAVDSYLAFLKAIPFPLIEKKQNQFFTFEFKNLFSLSYTIHYKKEETLELLDLVLGNQKLDCFFEYVIMRFVIESGKKITNEDVIFQKFYNISNRTFENNTDSSNTEYFLNFLISLSNKLKRSPIPYHNKLAEFHLDKAKGNSFDVLFSLKNAMDEYKKANNKEKMEEVAVLMEKAKKEINLTQVPFEYTDERIQKCFEYIDKVTDDLIEKCTSIEIFGCVILSKQIFPKAESLTKDNNPESFNYISVTSFDINKNISKNSPNFINEYQLYIDNISLQFLWYIFEKGIRNGKISFESLIDYLQNNTWFGSKLIEVTDKTSFNWIELLSPSLELFFKQLEKDIDLKKNNDSSYILCIDSLTLKFEGLLRDFCRNIDAQTIELDKTGTKAIIKIEAFLDNPKFKASVTEDDIALFKFLFTSDGMNLRNNIAHCFYKTKNYNPAKMLLLISAILKLGSYKFDIKD